MSTGSPRKSLAPRTLLVTVALVAPMLVLLLVPAPAAALGQSLAGFSEPAAGESFEVLDGAWTKRTDLRFAANEVVRVNVSSNTVDWLANAGGGGARALRLEDFRGTVLAVASFIQTTTGAFAQYTASLNLAPLGLATDWYYLHVFIDDTASVFETEAAIVVAPTGPAPAGLHSIRTFTDNTFAVESDVFTRTSVVWVEVVGVPGGNQDRWDLFEFVDRNSPVGGPRGGFPNFARNGNVYTFSIDLSAFAAGLVSGWYYTLEVVLSPPGPPATFLAGKQLQIFDPTLTIAGRDVAPATAAQGQSAVAMLGLNLTLNPNWATARGPAAFNLERLRFQRTGLGANADIAGIRIVRDGNGNGAIDVGEPLLASVFSAAGVAFPAWVGQAGVTMATIPSGGTLGLVVAYDISPFATPGNFDGVRLAGPADVGVHGSFVSILGLPAPSANAQITAAPSVMVTNDPGIAPGASPRGASVAVDLLALQTNGGTATLDALAVNLTGTAARSDVAMARLRADNGDGVFDPLADPSLAAATFPATGPAWFRNLGFTLGPAVRSVWIVYDVSPTATLGATGGSEITGATSVVVTGGASVFSASFPLRSGLAVITGPVLRIADTDLAALAPGGQVRQGRTNMPMLQLNLTTTGAQATVTGVRIDKTGTSVADSDVSRVKVWKDTGNNVFDIQDQLLGFQPFVAGTTVVGFGVSVGGGSWTNLFVTFDISSTATLGATVGARLADSTYVAVDPNTTVDPAPFAIASTNLVIVAGGPGALVSVSSVDLAANSAQAFRGQTDVQMLRLTLTADANTATISGVRVDKTGTSAVDGDVAAVRLWGDANGDGAWSASDTRLGSTSFVAGTAIFGGLNIPVPFGTPRTLFVTLDVAMAASTGQTVGVSLRNENYIAVDAVSSVDPTGFAHRSSNIPIAATAVGSISGTVSDPRGNPLAGATVTLAALGRTATTDALGAYRFANVPLGTYDVAANASGFMSQTASITLTTTEPDKVVNLALAVPLGGADLIPIGIGVALAAVVLLALFLMMARRRRRSQ